MPKSGTVNDAIAALIKKAKLDDEASAGPIRLFEVHGNKIHRELTREAPLSSVSDYTQVVAERCPKDELESDVGEFIYAYHFHHDPNKSHGVPFKFRVIEVSFILANIYDLAVSLTRNRVRSSPRRKSGWRSVRGSRVSTSTRSSSRWSNGRPMERPYTSLMVCTLPTLIYQNEI